MAFLATVRPQYHARRGLAILSMTLASVVLGTLVDIGASMKENRPPPKKYGQLMKYKCIDGSIADPSWPLAPHPDGFRCGIRAPDGDYRCPYGMCCSEHGYCGPTPGPDGNYHEGGLLHGPIITYEESELLFCSNNDGDWRFVDCDSPYAVKVRVPMNKPQRPPRRGYGDYADDGYGDDHDCDDDDDDNDDDDGDYEQSESTTAVPPPPRRP